MEAPYKTTMKYKILLVSFPFGENEERKIHPVLCLSEPTGEHEELVLAYISSKITKNALKTDVILSDTDKNFSSTGRKVRFSHKTAQINNLSKINDSQAAGDPSRRTQGRGFKKAPISISVERIS